MTIAGTRFDALLLELSAGLVGLDRGSIDDRQIELALERLATYLDVEAVLLAEVEDDRLGLRTTHAWRRPGVGVAVVGISREDFPWLTARVLAGETTRILRPDDFPRDATRDRDAFAARRLVSAVVSPVRIADAVSGAVGFASTRRDRAWSEEILRQLPLLGQTFAGALASKSAAARLQDEKDLAEAIIESLPGMYFMLDEHGRAVRWNRNREVVTGFSADELRNRHYLDFVQSGSRDLARRTFERALAGGIATFEHDVPTKDGRSIPHVVNARRAHLDGKTYVVGMGVDISALRAAQEQVRRQQAELAHVARVSAVGVLVAAIAHELNQPLAAMRTNAQAGQRMLSRGDADPAELADTFADIAGDAVRADQIIKHLRDLLRKGEIERTPLDANDLVRAIAPLVRADANAHGVGFTLDLAPDLPAVPGDAIQLQQVVLNLVRNGIDAMDGTSRDSAIAVHTRRGALAGIEIAVVDGGPALDDDAFARMFEPFYTTKPAGLGIGLSLSRSIVEAHGGSLWATRNAERGLTMHVTLPCDAATA